jgi:hypothetical protein
VTQARSVILHFYFCILRFELLDKQT